MASSNTRERILQTSLALFNAQGLPSVSTHRIAAEMGISTGNLHYHFKAKRLIVEWLFRRFEEKLSTLSEAAGSVRAIDDLWVALHLGFEAVNEYRFVYRDMAHLESEYPETAAKSRALMARNLLNARALCESLAAQGVIRASADEAEMLALQIVFTTTCWLSFERLVAQDAASRRTDTGLAAYYTLTLLAPYVDPPSRAYLDYLRAKYVQP
ncbi:TetR/AcrR family transcriptional regulator [Variovorax sp. J22G21]|uniref:TetR/AcrR family transcriptional regulator n=1 Tax=Variovorax fucosicus TaxID=3053517 RepID=UPI00257546CE|nr:MULTISPECIES: TetR/AcrR family transcriptional regulator [unclassified Variovorax]MDM0041446.1 TetR/AcrR family transcriptional regulator [Variovorax sp. J22R193]MDM0057810.1 TetR/AcrR family transcriptional regulator [Variovorax sp. J22G47]MDM0060502.1 TetR/AcrR family transcriptional regulator [Variovorax sp. J22G21]